MKRTVWMAMMGLMLVLALLALPAVVSAAAQANVSWTDVTNEDTYRVERSDDGGTTYAVVGTVTADVTNFTDDNAGVGLALNTLYCWQIVSSNDFGEAAPSAAACGEASTPDQVLGVQVLLSSAP